MKLHTVVSKDSSFHRYLILEILTNPDKNIILKEPSNIFWEKSIAYKFEDLLFADSFCLFSRTLASHNSMRKKDDMVCKKTS